MKKIKLLSSLALVGLTTAALTSCGGKTDSSKTIVFYNSAGSTIAGVINTAVNTFQQKYPGWTVEVVKQSDYDATFDKIVMDLQADELPSLAYCYPDHVASYMTAGVVLDINKFMNSTETVTTDKGTVNVGYTKEEIADFHASFINEGKGKNFYQASNYGFTDDSILCIPFMKSTEAMYVNMDQLQAIGVTEVPSTWDELWNVVDLLKAANPGDGYYPLCYDSEANWAINMCEQNGWGYTTNESANHYTFNNDNLAGWFDFLKGKYDQGKVLTKLTYNTSGAAYTSELFTKSGCTFCIGSSAGASYQNPNGAFEWAVAPIPGTKVGNTINSSVISQGPNLVMFDQGNSERANMTWLFIKELLDPTFQASMSISTGYNPVRTSSYEIEKYKEHLSGDSITAKTAEVASSQLSNFYTSAVFVGSSLARNQVGNALTYAISGKKTSKKALEDAYKACGGK